MPARSSQVTAVETVPSPAGLGDRGSRPAEPAAQPLSSAGMSEQPTVEAWTGAGAAAIRSTPRAYESVAHELLVLILGGHLAVGDRLPSERQLAARFGVSRPTCARRSGYSKRAGSS